MVLQAAAFLPMRELSSLATRLSLAVEKGTFVEHMNEHSREIQHKQENIAQPISHSAQGRARGVRFTGRPDLPSSCEPPGQKGAEAPEGTPLE